MKQDHPVGGWCTYVIYGNSLYHASWQYRCRNCGAQTVIIFTSLQIFYCGSWQHCSHTTVLLSTATFCSCVATLQQCLPGTSLYPGKLAFRTPGIHTFHIHSILRVFPAEFAVGMKWLNKVTIQLFSVSPSGICFQHDWNDSDAIWRQKSSPKIFRDWKCQFP